MKEKKRETRLNQSIHNKCNVCGYQFHSWTPAIQTCICGRTNHGMHSNTVLTDLNDPAWYRQESSQDRYRHLSDEITKLRKEIEKLTEEVKNRDTEIIVNELRKQIRELL